MTSDHFMILYDITYIRSRPRASVLFFKRWKLLFGLIESCIKQICEFYGVLFKKQGVV